MLSTLSLGPRRGRRGRSSTGSQRTSAQAEKILFELTMVEVRSCLDETSAKKGVAASERGRSAHRGTDERRAGAQAWRSGKHITRMTQGGVRKRGAWLSLLRSGEGDGSAADGTGARLLLRRTDRLGPRSSGSCSPWRECCAGPGGVQTQPESERRRSEAAPGAWSLDRLHPSGPRESVGETRHVPYSDGRSCRYVRTGVTRDPRGATKAAPRGLAPASARRFVRGPAASRTHGPPDGPPESSWRPDARPLPSRRCD